MLLCVVVEPQNDEPDNVGFQIIGFVSQVKFSVSRYQNSAGHLLNDI